jgi:creatinine amidohydrolase
MRKVQWELMFPDELEKAFRDCPVVYFTYGLCEPHGPQNALGLDALKAHAIACRTAERHGGIVAPADFWHIHEVGGYALWADREIGRPERHWMTAVPPWQHFKNVCYQIRVADALGFQAAILLTGHYGPNYTDLKTLVDRLQPFVGARLYALPEFESNYKGFTGNGTETGDHAGKVETSLLWALRPECVDISRIPVDFEQGKMFAMGKNAAEASRLVGERMVEDEIEWLGAKAKELLAEYQVARPVHQFKTFSAVEKVWEEVLLPILPSFESMKMKWEWQEEEALDSDSPWLENQAVLKFNG